MAGSTQQEKLEYQNYLIFLPKYSTDHNELQLINCLNWQCNYLYTIFYLYILLILIFKKVVIFIFM